MPKVKEPNYFNFDINTGYINSLEEYEALYKHVNSDHIAIGEASTGYIYSEEAVKNILEYNPKAKFIVMLRNPVTMAPSLHEQQFFEGNEYEKDFVTAWNLQGERQQGHSLGKFYKEQKLLQYGNICKLGKQVSALFDQVPKERVMILLLDDVKKDPKKEYLRTLSFLDVPDDGYDEFRVLNTAKTSKSSLVRNMIFTTSWLRKKIGFPGGIGILKRLNEINTIEQKRTPIDMNTKNELIEYFRDDILLLESLIDQDLSMWLD